MGHEFLLFAPERPAPLGNPEASFSLEELSYEELASYPHREEIRPFYMATAETNQAQFERFLEDNPQWRKANLAELLAEGSVTEEYLEYSNTGDRIPVTNVSWFAARAYCRWLTGQLPENLQGEYRAVLPTESQWEYAARSNGRPRSVGRELRVNAPLPAAFSRAGARGLIDMTGNVWEWNRNWYFLADLLDGTYGLNQKNRAGMERAEFPVYRGAEKSVRGGSWANEIDEQMVWSRASQEPSWCTPFTGFRVALVSAEDGSPGQDESR
jgi:formylglycine-generating enzyme required for sulfatase activity